MKTLTTAACAFAAALALSSGALASGGGGFSSSSFSQRTVDKTYEQGKAFYREPLADGTRLEYCVKQGDDLTKLTRRSVSAFKRGPASAFVDSLYSCAEPDTKIAELVSDDKGEAILYYLNKRFKLRLTEG